MSDDRGNFSFLEQYDERVAHLAQQAEHYVHSDPDSCMFKLRLMVETMARTLASLQLPHLVSADLGSMLGGLQRSGVLPRRQADGMHAIRRDGNAAVHGSPTPVPTAMRRLHDAHRLSAWFAKMVKRGAKIQPGDFVPPDPPAPLNAVAQAINAKVDELEQSIEERRHQTREALLMFGPSENVDDVVRRTREELDALDKVAAAAGEPVIDADFVALVMAMDLEQLEEHADHGGESRRARRAAEHRLDAIKEHLDRREQEFLAERTWLMEQRGEV